MTTQRLAAKDLDAEDIVAFIRWQAKEPSPYTGARFDHDRTVLVGELAAAFDVPEKVIRAKMKRLIEKGIVDGCACGCRGDFSVVPS